MRSLFLFAVSGGVGFLIDASVYYVSAHIFNFYISKIISFMFAVFFTWMFNRSITFKGYVKKGSIFIEFMKYLSSMTLGGLMNYLTFILLMNEYDLIKLYPVIGIACGSVVGMISNFILSKFLIYKK
jgi:hypothetical conserved membrane protein